MLICLIPKAKAQQACFIILNDTLNLQAGEGEYEGCAPFSVKARNCSDGAVSYDFNNQGGIFNPAQFFQDSTHTYWQVGTYTIAQFRGPGIPLAFKTIKVFNPSSRPEFQWKTCGTRLLIECKDSLFSRYSFRPKPGPDSLIINGKSFEYDYGSAAGSPFTFSLRGLRPSTCNKEALNETVSLYDSPRAPVPLILQGQGSDTLSYLAKVAVRADEDFAFQLAKQTPDFSGLLAPGRSDEDNPGLEIPLALSADKTVQGGQLRAITRKFCGSGADTLLASSAWTIFWPRCESENQKITLRWPALTIPGLTKFEIWRDGQLLAQPALGDGLYVDQNGLVCGSDYSYRFRTEVSLPGGGKMIFLSAEVKASAISNQAPDPLPYPTATVLPRGIRISAKASSLASLYHLFRREKEGTQFEEIGSGYASLPIIDTTALSSSRAYCYRLSFDDVCGNRSLLSDSICPILLKASQEDAASIAFQWTAMEGWEGGPLRYDLIRKVAGLPDLVRHSGQDLTHELQGQDKDSKRLIFQIRCIPKEPGLYPEASFSNEVEIIQKSRMRFPDSFTPNNDGINDGFRCYGSFLKTFQLIIYNSWGNVVYSSDIPDAEWDGRIDGQPAQTGNYAFRAIATDETGERLEKSGFFSLIR